MSVLVWAVLTNYHRPRGLNSGQLFLTVLETGGENQRGQVPGVGRLPGSHLSSLLFAVSSHGGKDTSQSLASSRKALIPFVRAPPHNLRPPKGPSPNTTILGLGVSTWEFGGNTNILSIALIFPYPCSGPWIPL